MISGASSTTLVKILPDRGTGSGCRLATGPSSAGRPARSGPVTEPGGEEQRPGGARWATWAEPSPASTLVRGDSHLHSLPAQRQGGWGGRCFTCGGRLGQGWWVRGQPCSGRGGGDPRWRENSKYQALNGTRPRNRRQKASAVIWSLGSRTKGGKRRLTRQGQDTSGSRGRADPKSKGEARKAFRGEAARQHSHWHRQRAAAWTRVTGGWGRRGRCRTRSGEMGGSS